MSVPTSFSESGLRAAGFEGFVPFEKLPQAGVPADPGVYVVLRTCTAPPTFLKANAAGRFKGRDPSVSIQRLEREWVPGATVIYIGKATRRKDGSAALAARLSEYRRHGEGEAVGHWGGRLVWQLADRADLLVCWRGSPTDDAADLEAALLDEFSHRYGALPFANLRRERRPKKP